MCAGAQTGAPTLARLGGTSNAERLTVEQPIDSEVQIPEDSPPWETPVLVKVDVSQGTLLTASTHGSDGIFSS